MRWLNFFWNEEQKLEDLFSNRIIDIIIIIIIELARGRDEKTVFLDFSIKPSPFLPPNLWSCRVGTVVGITITELWSEKKQRSFVEETRWRNELPRRLKLEISERKRAGGSPSG